MPRPSISPEKHDQIVELRLAGVPVRDVAAQVEVAPNTVVKHYRTYLKQRAKERVEQNEERVAELERRLERNWHTATNAATAALLTDDPNAARFLDLERKALESLTKFTDRVSEPELAGKVTGAQAEALAKVIRDAAADLPPEQRAAFLTAAVERLRSLA